MASWKKVVVSGSAVTQLDFGASTILSGSITSQLPEGLLSSSAQIASDISGAFGAASASFSTRVSANETSITTLNSAGLLSSSAQIASDISGAFGAASASFSTRVSANETSITTLNSAGLLSSSAQIASDISGAFVAPSSSFSTRVTSLEDGSGLPDGVLSSSAQIASDISGAFGAASASFSTRVSANETSITTLNSAGLLSSSAQIASDISGAFTATSSSLESRVTANEDDKLALAGGTITGDLAVDGNLSVAGTASFNHSTNLSVADKYILLNSGSSTVGDGGIVIQQATNGKGELFGYDASANRFGITGSFDADTSGDFVPSAFISMVISGSSGEDAPSDAPRFNEYQQAGNIFAGANGDIYIYSS